MKNNLKNTLKNKLKYKNKHSIVCCKNRYIKDILIYNKLGCRKCFFYL